MVTQPKLMAPRPVAAADGGIHLSRGVGSDLCRALLRQSRTSRGENGDGAISLFVPTNDCMVADAETRPN